MHPEHSTHSRRQQSEADPAAILGASLSLYASCMAQARAEGANLSVAYQGGDQFMREVMRVAQEFELWACEHVNFDEWDEVWPYFLQDRFGPACVSILSAAGLASFSREDCVRISLRLGIPLRMDRSLPVPICAEAPIPTAGSPFHSLLIQTVRDSIDGELTCAYTRADEPFDDALGPIYFSLYGICQNGLLEHIASRQTYDEILALATALVPEIHFTAIARTWTARRSQRKHGSD